MSGHGYVKEYKLDEALARIAELEAAARNAARFVEMTPDGQRVRWEEIERMTVRIAELEAENARLTAINADLCAVNLRHAEAIAILALPSR